MSDTWVVPMISAAVPIVLLGGGWLVERGKRIKALEVLAETVDRHGLQINGEAQGKTLFEASVRKEVHSALLHQLAACKDERDRITASMDACRSERVITEQRLFGKVEEVKDLATRIDKVLTKVTTIVERIEKNGNGKSPTAPA